MFDRMDFVKIIFLILFFFGMLVLVSQIEAEDNKTSNEPRFTAGGFPLILDDDRWPSQLLYDTIGA